MKTEITKTESGGEVCYDIRVDWRALNHLANALENHVASKQKISDGYRGNDSLCVPEAVLVEADRDLSEVTTLSRSFSNARDLVEGK